MRDFFIENLIHHHRQKEQQRIMPLSKKFFSSRRLPPLTSKTTSLNNDPVIHRTRSPCSTSRYHQNCAYSTNSSNERTTEQNGFLAKKVIEFLRENGNFLEEYVMRYVSMETLERWRARKSQIIQKQSKSIESVKDQQLRKNIVPQNKMNAKMLQELTKSIFSKSNKMQILTELSRTIASSVNTISWNLFYWEESLQKIYSFDPNDNVLKEASSSQNDSCLAAYVAKTRKVIRTNIYQINKYRMFADIIIVSVLDKIRSKSMFPDIIIKDSSFAYFLCHPIIQSSGELFGMLELYRSEEIGEFDEDDEEMVNSYLVWGGMALHYSELYANLIKQRQLNNFLLDVVKSIFKDMVTMDIVIVKIMMFAQKLVKADRASLFLVDHQSKELFARIFDVKSEENKSESAKEIRIPLGSGIAGFVALTGQSLNIPDVYNDHRFNRSIDQQTGYTTRNLLCMPIYLRNTIIGVVQMVNKDEGLFNEEDEEAFSIFSVYCGLALHHAKLYDKIRRSEQKYKVAIEVLMYHNTCTEEEVEEFKNITSPVNCEDLMDYNFSSYSLNGNEKIVSTTQMFIDLFGLKKFELDCLLRFTLTVRKNYRRVPYHNWGHGFSVANSSFVIIKNARGVFRPFEELALFISCLCHDLDHRGKTNQFLINSESPLAAIYTTSTLEHHHFNQTISILQQDGHNIFRHLTSEEYKQLLGNIKHCILATDLARFFPYKEKLQSLIDDEKFDWNDTDHRLLLEAVTMTACDLCASTKPWEQQKETVNVIFEEFYEQGDAERAQGREPIPMMDRNKPNEQASSQVSFLKGICVPCYELIYKLIPQTKPMIDGCLVNLKKWQQLLVEKLENTLDKVEDKED